MEFRLKYEGSLKSGNKATKADKHKLRKAFHPQLKELWNLSPLNNEVSQEWLKPNGKPSVIKKVVNFQFANLISTRIAILAELDIVLMRPEEPGKIITSGDIDNCLKTLFDALRCPKNANELPRGIKPSNDEKPFYCLLEDDSLITSVNVNCDRLLEYKKKTDVLLIIHIRTKLARVTVGNISLL